MNKPTYKKDHRNTNAFLHGGRIVCGTSGLGGVWGEIVPDESVDAILYALERGVHAFDTAPSYANAELYLGMALKQWGGEKPFLSTKAGRLRSENAFDLKSNYTDSALEKSLHQSLELLGVEYIDLLFLHEPQCVLLSEAGRVISCLQRFKEQGLIKSVGIGGNPPHSFYSFVKKENFEVVSGFLKLDACNISALQDDIPLLQREGIRYYAASSLHFALLGSRFEKYLKKGADGVWVSQRDIENAVKVKQLATRNNMSLSTLAQRYLFSVNEADRIVVGARNLQQMQDTLNDWEEGSLTENLFDEITTILMSKS